MRYPNNAILARTRDVWSSYIYIQTGGCRSERLLFRIRVEGKYCSMHSAQRHEAYRASPIQLSCVRAYVCALALVAYIIFSVKYTLLYAAAAAAVQCLRRASIAHTCAWNLQRFQLYTNIEFTTRYTRIARRAAAAAAARPVRTSLEKLLTK